MGRAHALLLLCFASISYAKTKIVVLDVKSSDAATLRLAAQLQEQLLTELSGNTRFEVLGKSDIEALLGLERQKELLGCADGSNCLAELGGALGAQYLVAGTVGHAGALFRVDLKVIDTKESKAVFRGGKTLEREDELYAVVDSLARDLAASIPLEPGTSTSPRPVLPWVATGAGVAVTACGVVFLGLGSVSQGGFESARPGLTFSQATARVEGIERYYSAGWALAASGLVLIAAGIVWYLVAR